MLKTFSSKKSALVDINVYRILFYDTCWKKNTTDSNVKTLIFKLIYIYRKERNVFFPFVVFILSSVSDPYHFDADPDPDPHP